MKRLLAVLGIFWAAQTTGAELSMTLAGPAETVFAWDSMRCETWDIPDAPARAWRDRTGQVHLLAAHLRARALIGPDLDHVRHDCAILFEGGGKDAPEAWDDRGWLASPYALDGQRVMALVHDEFHGHLRPALCPAADYLACWHNAITLALSQDGGARFALAPVPLIAAPALRYSGNAGHRTGFFNPSNILFRDGYYYAFFWAEAEGRQQRGACLMRSSDPASAPDWRGWDGQAFTVEFTDPYDARSVAGRGDAPKRPCVPVAPESLISFVSGVVRYRGIYVALMATAREGIGSGIMMATSPDLLSWSAPRLILTADLPFRRPCAGLQVVSYPVLLDPVSKTRNFEEIGRHPYLYFTRSRDCSGGPERDLIRIPVSIAE